MRETPTSTTRINRLITLWGLLFTKCFLLEFLVRHYGVPINSLTYVWALSLVMASVATAVYINLQKQEFRLLFKQPSFAIASLTSLVATLFVLLSLTAPAQQGGMALASAALMLTIRHFWLSARKTGAGSRLKALCWMVAAMAIAYLGTPLGFLVFAAVIVCLVVIPGLAQFIAQRKARRAGAPGSVANS